MAWSHAQSYGNVDFLDLFDAPAARARQRDAERVGRNAGPAFFLCFMRGRDSGAMSG